MKRITALIAPAIFTLGLAAPAQADLGQEPRVTEGLIAVGIAYEISRVCPQIDARTLRGVRYLWQLRDTARQLGYSDAQIDAFIDNRSEKTRLEGIARSRLRRAGVASGDVEAHCRFGRAQIAQDNAIGRLLK